MDVEMNLSLKKACQTDDLKDTINYEAIYQTVDGCVKRDKFYLIEALANSIARDVLNNHPVDSLTIRVRKPHAPVRGVLDTVEVEIERARADYA